MFASQLLRILQTVPSDAKNRSCTDDLVERDMTMKENQTDSFDFGSKEIYEFKDSSQDKSPPCLEAKGRDDNWSHKVMDDFAINDKNRSADSLSSEKFFKDKEQRIPEHECLMTMKDSRSPCSDMFHAKLDCELPELEVCYNENEHPVVKDICIDEGRREADKNLIEHRKKGKSRLIFPKPLDNCNRCKTEDGVELELFISGELEPSLLEDSWKTDEAICSLTRKNAFGSSEEESLLDWNLPIQEFGTRSFLRSFLCTLDGEVNNAAQLPNQALNEKPVSKSSTVDTTVETESITLNFEELTAESRDLPDHKGKNADYPLDNRHLWMSGKHTHDENVHKQSLEHKGDMSGDLSNEQDQLPGNRGRRPTDGNAQVFEPNVSKNDQRSTDNASIVNQLQYDEGETSFYADSFITYSGPLPFSGSLSHRSDGSATSGKSFAFPVLRPEWNSSPVRMVKGDMRRLRKHKDWKSQLLCCKF